MTSRRYARGASSELIPFTSEEIFQLGQCAGRDERHPAASHSSAKSGFHLYRSRMLARTSFSSALYRAVSYPFERGDASQAFIDGLALLFGLLFLSLFATATGASLFILISFH